MRITKLAGALAVVGLATVSGAAFATNGYFSHGYGMKAKGMGGAGIAFGQDALAAATNPANMVLVGDRMDIGADWFSPIRKTNVNGLEYESASNNFLVPEFGYNKMMASNWSLGVSVFGNGGMNTNYDPITNPFSNGPRTGVDLSQLFISPTIAFKINQNHAIGASLNLAYQRFKASGIGNFAPYSTSSGNLTDRGYDNSTGMGVRLGWTGNISPEITLGATWQSRTKMSKFDKYKGLFAEQGDFDIPANFGVGTAFKVTPALTVAADFVRIQYGDVKSINNNISVLAVNTLGNSNGAGFGWDDQNVYKIGASYEYSKHLTLRAGWNHGDVPFPGTETAFNILAPAVVTDHVTLGGTWTLDNKAEVTVAYMHAFEGEVTTGTTLAAGSGTANRLRMYQNSLGISYGMKY